MKLKELRTAQNLNQKELAEKLGYSQNTISQWESGKRSMDADTLARIADFFGVTTDAVLGRPITVKCSGGRDPAEDKMLVQYNKLNDFGKREAVKRVAELCMIPQYTATAMPIAAHTDKALDDKELDLMRQDIDEL